jgi:phage-related minor tail protein
MAAAERNVGIRLQVIDGGKVKAEFAEVGAAGAQSLDALTLKSQQAAAAMNKLRTHEVTNLSAQLSDIGVSLASGQSPLMVMIQQGAQISSIMGDRGVKGILAGVGAGLVSMINPTTAILAGIVAVGYAASYVFNAMSGDTEDATEALKRHDEIIKRVTDRYGEVAAAAKGFTDQQREIDLAESGANARSRRTSFMEESGNLAGELGRSSRLGFVVDSDYSAYSGPIP